LGAFGEFAPDLFAVVVIEKQRSAGSAHELRHLDDDSAEQGVDTDGLAQSVANGAYGGEALFELGRARAPFGPFCRRGTSGGCFLGGLTRQRPPHADNADGAATPCLKTPLPRLVCNTTR